MKKYILYLLLTTIFSVYSNAQSSQFSDVYYFLDLVTSNSKLEKVKALDYIEKNWKTSYEIMALETMYFGYNSELGLQLALLLQKKTRQDFGLDFNAWYEYLWNKPQELHPDYAYFKSQLHKHIDPKFENYFQGRQSNPLIRLDEIRWGGVVQNGIPPLRNPEMITASDATYLEDDHIVFGIEINGEARAYPKRILAWHEMFTDTIQGIPVAGVYCTLCGTVILYKTEFEGVQYKIGTSGFLYRSNKLMYDQKTQSLWSTLEGKPVVGPLVNKGIQFDYLSVVTTTWKQWKELHPETTVLSLNTGHNRDYGEGVAYKNYFADDVLMFNVPQVNSSLKNKESILAIRLENYPLEPLAVSVKYLKKHRVFQNQIGDQRFTIITDRSGANRVYATDTIEFKKYKDGITITDTEGTIWRITEEALIQDNGTRLERIPTFNAFWFGWQAAYPHTKLIK